MKSYMWNVIMAVSSYMATIIMGTFVFVMVSAYTGIANLAIDLLVIWLFYRAGRQFWKRASKAKEVKEHEASSKPFSTDKTSPHTA